MTTPEVKALQAALRVAKKKIPMLSVKTRNARLEYAADDLAEAYEIGLVECQREIIHRIQKLLTAATGEPKTPKPKPGQREHDLLDEPASSPPPAGALQGWAD